MVVYGGGCCAYKGRTAFSFFLILLTIPMADYKCSSCGSTAQGEAGTCCGAAREEQCADCKQAMSKCTCGK